MGHRKRVMVFSPQDEPLFEIRPDHVHELRRTEAINAEHAITITTTMPLEKNQRILTRDGTGKWHEHVVTGIDEPHQNGRRVVGTYYAVWSLQHDLMGTYTTRMPGTGGTPVSAREALEAAISGTSRWQVGTVTLITTGSASFYYKNGWEALSLLIKTWGGEVDVTIEVGPTGVVSRKVDLYAQQGSNVAVRRFDYGVDLVGIRRKVADSLVTPRIIPRGKAQETDGGGYGRRTTIESVNGGVPYLTDSESATIYRVPDGSGGWEYPVQVIETDDYEEPADIKAWAESVKERYTRPQVTYEADVLQFAAAGMDVRGLALGDVSQCVDRKFSDEGLRISGRVVKLVIDELDPTNTSVTLGYLSAGMSGAMGDLRARVDGIYESITGSLQYMSTAAYVDALLARLNDEINVLGGYTYITQGQGIRCYDTAVTDPLVGSEANSVVEIKGGAIRIANSRTAQGDWDWKTVFVSGHVLAELVTAAQLTSGYIGSADSGNFWNLDTGQLRMAATAVTVGSKTLAQFVEDAAGDALTQEAVFNALTNNGALQGIYMANNRLYINASYIASGSMSAGLITAGKIQSKNGKVYFDLDNNELVCDKMVSTDSSNSVVANIGTLRIGTTAGGYGGYTNVSGMLIGKSGSEDYGIVLSPGDSNTMPKITTGALNLNLEVRTQQGGSGRSTGPTGLMLTKNGYAILHGQVSTGLTESTAVSSTATNDLGRVICYPAFTGSGSTYTADGTIEMMGSARFPHATTWFNSLEVRSGGIKSKIADTENYGQRMLYCVEATNPLYSDIGSGAIGEDGTCYVEIDDVFSETVRCDLGYQVFLQRCGDGDLWVSEKHPTHFVVEGTPGMRFDWEVKARQIGFECDRLEDREATHQMIEPDNLWSIVEHQYSDEEGYVETLESIYEQEVAYAASA